MEFCQFCGTALAEGAQVCHNCGNATGVQARVNNQQGLEKAIRVFLIISTIMDAFCYLIPLAWVLPMAASIRRKLKKGEPIGTGFKVACIFLISPIVGILLLCHRENA